MTTDQLAKIHNALALQTPEGWILAAMLTITLSGGDPVGIDEKTARLVMRRLLQSLLDNERFIEAAVLLWGSETFDTRPEAVQRVFKGLNEGHRVLLMGASSMSKTYSAAAYMYLQWRMDPYFTSIKLAAINEDHLRKNLYAHMLSFHRMSSIPFSDDPNDILIRDHDLYMGVKSAGMEFGVSGIAFKQSDNASGNFKGYKPKPFRTKPHPKFGYMSRTYVLGDEGQNWPNGPFKDFNSLVASINSSKIVKLVICFNPEDAAQTVVKLAEPEAGWDEDGMEELHDWVSKAGWRAVRLDAAKSENVIQKKEVYAGFQTYEGFLSYIKSGGDTSAAYYTFARGWPPLRGAVNNVIEVSWAANQRGEAVFVGPVTHMASVDLAYQGQDTSQMAIARWGLASGWNKNGIFTPFFDRMNPGKKKPRHVLQIDQIIPLTKGHDTVTTAQEIMEYCKAQKIKPEWVVVDKTGNGFGTWSHLIKYWGPVTGIMWSAGASELRVLSEDPEPAKAYYDGISSEMWFAFKRWMDPIVCAILVNPIIPTSPLNTQLTSRRFRRVKGGKLKVERKDEYKARNQQSPDEADAVIMLPQLIRMKGDALPGTKEHEVFNNDDSDTTEEAGKIVPLKNASADQDDSLESTSAGHHEMLE